VGYDGQARRQDAKKFFLVLLITHLRSPKTSGASAFAHGYVVTSRRGRPMTDNRLPGFNFAALLFDALSFASFDRSTGSRQASSGQAGSRACPGTILVVKDFLLTPEFPSPEPVEG